MTARVSRALVTGASAGIGASFARQLAGRGVELVLVARRTHRLDALSAELDVDVEVLPADLAVPEELRRVEARLAAHDAPVDLLVNNAGLGVYGRVDTLDPDRQTEIVDVNVRALVRLSRAVLPRLVASGAGGIVNVGSTAGFQPNPYGAVYGATKAFVRSFTEALHEELRGTGVRAMLLAPGITETEFQAVADIVADAIPARVRMDADTVVEVALRDYAAGRVVSVPGAINRLGSGGAQVMPSALTRRLSGIIHRRYVGS